MSILNTFGLSLDASIRLEILYLLLNGLEMIDCCFDGYSLLYSRAIFRNKPIFPFDDNSLYLYTLNSSVVVCSRPNITSFNLVRFRNLFPIFFTSPSTLPSAQPNTSERVYTLKNCLMLPLKAFVAKKI
eukprot:209293_1